MRSYHILPQQISEYIEIVFSSCFRADKELKIEIQDFKIFTSFSQLSNITLYPKNFVCNGTKSYIPHIPLKNVIAQSIERNESENRLLNHLVVMVAAGIPHTNSLARMHSRSYAAGGIHLPRLAVTQLNSSICTPLYSTIICKHTPSMQPPFLFDDLPTPYLLNRLRQAGSCDA